MICTAVTSHCTVCDAIVSLMYAASPPQVREVVQDQHLLQFGMLIGESSAELAIGQQHAAHPVGPTPASLFGQADASSSAAAAASAHSGGCGGGQWERLVEEHRPGLHYWACRKPLRKGLYMYKSRTGEGKKDREGYLLFLWQ